MLELVLWDIDHTLMATRGVGRELWEAAWEDVTGIPMREQAEITGSTEQVIWRETARLHGLHDAEQSFGRFAEALGTMHEQQAAVLRERGHALPGAGRVLEAIAASGVRQTTVTGNVRAAAAVKLAVFGLDSHIDLDIGAFAEDAETRPKLVRTALSRAGVDGLEPCWSGMHRRM